MYIYICIYIYIYIYKFNHVKNMPNVTSRLSAQWLCGNSCTLGHMMYGYTLLLPRNQRVLNNPIKERYQQCLMCIMCLSA